MSPRHLNSVPAPYALCSPCDVPSCRHRYTGPCFHKYNLVLRSSGNGPDFIKKDCERTCLGNTYTTTLHVLNSCIVKLSKLTKVTKVYRGLAGGVLPNEFWTPNKVNVRGGVEVSRQIKLRLCPAPTMGLAMTGSHRTAPIMSHARCPMLLACRMLLPCSMPLPCLAGGLHVYYGLPESRSPLCECGECCHHYGAGAGDGGSRRRALLALAVSV